MWIELSIAAAAALGVALLGVSWYGRWSAGWGASAAEQAMELTGDDWLTGGSRVRLRMTRAIAIAAPPETVWPWLAQLGRGAGWYSYDRLDNGGRPSARHLVGWIPAPRPGDAIPLGYLRHLEPGRELVWWLAGVRFLGSRFRAVTLYRLIGDGDRCRLVMRLQADVQGLLARPSRWAVRAIDGFMARRQLLGIRERAERYGRRGRDPERPETGARDQYQLYEVIYASGEGAGVAGREGAASCRQAAIDDGVVETAAA